jgi:hypothetical protein
MAFRQLDRTISSPPGLNNVTMPMQVFDVPTLAIEPDRIVLQLGPRPAICEPRHRATGGISAKASESKKVLRMIKARPLAGQL